MMKNRIERRRREALEFAGENSNDECRIAEESLIKNSTANFTVFENITNSMLQKFLRILDIVIAAKKL